MKKKIFPNPANFVLQIAEDSLVISEGVFPLFSIPKSAPCWHDREKIHLWNQTISRNHSSLLPGDIKMGHGFYSVSLSIDLPPEDSGNPDPVISFSLHVLKEGTGPEEQVPIGCFDCQVKRSQLSQEVIWVNQDKSFFDLIQNLFLPQGVTVI